VKKTFKYKEVNQAKSTGSEKVKEGLMPKGSVKTMCDQRPLCETKLAVEGKWQLGYD